MKKLTPEQKTLRLRFKAICRKVRREYKDQSAKELWNNKEVMGKIHSHFTLDERMELTKNCDVCALTNEEYLEMI